MFVGLLCFHTPELPTNAFVMIVSFMGVDMLKEYKEYIKTGSLVAAIISGVGWAGLSGTPFGFLVYADTSY